MDPNDLIERYPDALGSYDSLRSALQALLPSDAEPLDEQSNLIECGLDSVRLMALIDAFDAQGKSLSLMDLVEDPSFGNMANLLGVSKGDSR